MNPFAAPIRRLLPALAVLGTTLLATAQSGCELLALAQDTVMSATTAKLWNVNTLTGAVSNPRIVNTGAARAPLAMAMSPAGVLYGVSQGTTGDVPPGGGLWTINVTTGAPTFVANLTQWLSVEGDIAFDPTTGVLYAVTGIGDLFTIDTSTGVCTTVGNLPQDQNGGSDYSGLAFETSGQLWVWSTFGQVLRKVDKTNATIQSTVVTNPAPAWQVGGLAFDPGNGNLFLAGDVSGSVLSSIHAPSGAATTIGPMTGTLGVWALAFDHRGCATVATVGTGCTSTFASFYETMTASAMDLSGKVVTGTFGSSSYTVTTGPGPGFAAMPGVPPLPLGNDTQIAVGTLGLWVGSNGWLARGPNNTTSPFPNPFTLLNNPDAQVSAWTDLDPSAGGSGGVYYDEPAPGVGRVLYDGVFGTGTTNPNSLQITWNVVTGDFAIEFGALASWNPQPWLVGWSPAGPSADPGPSDISAFGGSPLTRALFDTLPLGLAAVGRPVQGFVAANFQATTTNIDWTTTMHFGIIGLTDPNLPLSFLGLPNDCFLRASLDVVNGPHMFPMPVHTWNVLNLPAATPWFLGFAFHVQSATLDNSGLGPTTRVSNGLRCVVGNL